VERIPVIQITRLLDYDSAKAAKAGERKVMVNILWGAIQECDPENVKNLPLSSGSRKP
jgi:hypothetical protein